MPKQISAKKLSFWRTVAASLFLIMAAYILVANSHTVSRSLSIARGAHAGWLLLGLLLMACTFVVAAGIYGCLAIKKLRLSNTILVEVSSAFVNKLLPAGIGGIGLHGVYLYQQRHSTAQAATIVSVNNCIGMLAHGTLLVAVVLLQPHSFGALTTNIHPDAAPWALLLVGILTAIVVFVPHMRMQVKVFLLQVVKSLRQLRPKRTMAAYGLALILTCVYTAILWCAVSSLDIRLGVGEVFVIFSIGMLGATAAPTPGGLVGAEAAMFAGFIAYSIPAELAGAATLLYRLMTYWIPLLPGAVALASARRQKLV